MKKSIHLIIVIAFLACKQPENRVISPDVITVKTSNDTDDPAIWIDKNDPTNSIVFGTDKETNGAIYAFDLDGKIIEEKTIRNIQRPNNVDIEYGFALNDSTSVDILVFTEREKQQIRIFSVPDMKPLDGGGLPVFENDSILEYRLPMGIALYKSPIDEEVYAVVGRKSGPKENYLHQYKLQQDTIGNVALSLVREFGNFSGKKEIEAIAVDDALGHIYYSDENHCIRKYHAEPTNGNEEIACFGGEHFAEDIEGIAIAMLDDDEGFLIVSDQQRGTFNFFDRKTNAYVKSENLSTLETDGCEVVTTPLNDTFKSGLFVAMNDERNFFFYDFEKIK